MKKQIIELLKKGVPYKDIVEQVGCSKATISYHAKKIGLGQPNHDSGKRYDWDVIAEYYKTHTATETREHFGFAKNTWDKARERGEIISRGYTDVIIPIEEILVENSSYQTYGLKYRLIDSGILDNICVKCGISEEWNGKPISLHLDHINGISNDHRLKNLQILCPNCHSQTSTYAGRNRPYKNK